MSEVIMIASGKGGVGKTTLCALLGSEFARMDKTVVMLDTDFGLRNLDLCFRLENKIVYNLVDVLKGTCSIRQSLIPLNAEHSFYIIPGSRDYEYQMELEAFCLLIEHLRQRFDVVLIDTPAGITPVHHQILSVTDQCLLVMMLTEASLSDAMSISHLLREKGTDIRCIFNTIDNICGHGRQGRNLAELTRQIFDADYIGSIPRIQQKYLRTGSFASYTRKIRPICNSILERENMFRTYKLKNLNIKLIMGVLALTIVGILVIGSANYEYQSKQILGMLLGIVVMGVVALIDYDFVLQFSRLCYVAVIGLLILVLLVGETTAGATRWIDFGIRFQPSELGKVLLILFFANYLMQNEDDINEAKFLVKTAILAAIPLLLIVKEPDLSTTIVTFLIIATLLFVTGLSYKLIGIVLAIVIPAIGIMLWAILQEGNSLLQGYQNLRILAWLRPEDYPATAYQQQNSIMAIGSGQFLGKGLYNTSVDSVKNGNYISEPQTDFIFAVAGEELGFVGSVLIILLLLFIVYQCIQTAKSAKDLSGKLICSGMAALIGFQSFVNICVVTGLFPNTGLPLPFVSYGLTSLVTLYFGIGFVLNVGLQAKKY